MVLVVAVLDMVVVKLAVEFDVEIRMGLIVIEVMFHMN